MFYNFVKNKPPLKYALTIEKRLKTKADNDTRLQRQHSETCRGLLGSQVRVWHVAGSLATHTFSFYIHLCWFKKSHDTCIIIIIINTIKTKFKGVFLQSIFVILCRELHVWLLILSRRSCAQCSGMQAGYLTWLTPPSLTLLFDWPIWVGQHPWHFLKYCCTLL